jgi:arabinose-5-phosphate isomerase
VHHGFPKVLINATLDEIILEISNKRLGATCVVDPENNLLGIITDGDLRRVFKQSLSDKNITAEAMMCSTPKIINEDAYAVEALGVMRDNNVSQLVVVNDQNKPLGMIHLHDLLREGIV